MLRCKNVLYILCPSRSVLCSFLPSSEWRGWTPWTALTQLPCPVNFSCKGNTRWKCWKKDQAVHFLASFCLGHSLAAATLFFPNPGLLLGSPFPQLQPLSLSNHSFLLCLQSFVNTIPCHFPLILLTLKIALSWPSAVTHLNEVSLSCQASA